MIKEKSKRNKTLDINLEEGKVYFDRCILEPNFNGETVNATICGDTFNVLKKIKKNSVDLIIVDPPYNLEKNFHGNRFSPLEDEEYRKYTESWLIPCVELLKENGSMYVCCDWKSSLIIGEVLKRNLIVRNRITWQREKGRGAKKNWKNCLEDIWFATKSDEYTFNIESVKVKRKVIAPYKENGVPKDWQENDGEKYRFTCPSNIWGDISVPYWSMKENTAHPTQKPEKLLAKLILASSNQNDLVFDPFLGSGSTSVVAKKLGRRYIGVEQNPTYCVWAEKRLEDANEDKTIQGYENGIFINKNF